MAVMLAADAVELYPPDTAADSHGWTLPGTAPAWTGTGNLQLTPGRSDPGAGDGGGTGPFGPAVTAAGVLFLPPDADAADGTIAVIRGESYVLSQVRLERDPAGGTLDCLEATVTGTETWPGGVNG